MERIKEDYNEINSFLGYRYCPRKKFKINEDILLARKNKDEYSSYTNEQLIELGQKALSSSSVKHFVPLSGGFDSRIILGELLKKVDKKQIITLTYGVPGSLDYEIGAKVAKKMGVKNIRVNLSPDVFSWNEDRLSANAKNYNNPNILFRGYDVYEYVFKKESFDDNYVFWSGFMGDVLTGVKFYENEANTWEKALERFVSQNFNKTKLVDKNFDPKIVLPSEPILDKNILSYDEQLNYFVRQPFYLENSVCPKSVFQHVETPYLQSNFLRFILNIPREKRNDRKFFIKMSQQRHRELFSLPFQSKYGLRLDSNPRLILAKKIFLRLKEELCIKINMPQPSSKTQFIDWNVGLSKSKNLNNLAAKNLSDLANRNIIKWFDVEKYLQDQKKSKSYGENIRKLISLELLLKLNDKN